jgi:hypothetical protein
MDIQVQHMWFLQHPYQAIIAACMLHPSTWASAVWCKLQHFCDLWSGPVSSVLLSDSSQVMLTSHLHHVLDVFNVHPSHHRQLTHHAFLHSCKLCDFIAHLLLSESECNRINRGTSTRVRSMPLICIINALPHHCPQQSTYSSI